MASVITGPRAALCALVTVGGSAALSWQVLWQIHCGLALGVSAWGAAITLAAVMGGFCVGAWLMGNWLGDRPPRRALRLYGLLEAGIGLSGVLLDPMFRVVEALDMVVFRAAPDAAPLLHIASLAVVLGAPALCMGATVPLFGWAARSFNMSIAVLYGANTLGACAGCLLAAFLLIPWFGLQGAAWVIAGINFAVAGLAWLVADRGRTPTPPEAVSSGREQAAEGSPGDARLLVAVTGFVTLALEVAWFRSLVAAFQSTTTAFAVMLAAVLLSLGIAATLAPLLKRRRLSLAALLGAAGVLILLATPIVERFDSLNLERPRLYELYWFAITFAAIGPPMTLLGIALPWLLDDQRSGRRWGGLYAVNTLAAIAGSLTAAWILLPAMGFSRTAWLLGAGVAVTGMALARPRGRIVIGVLATLGLGCAVAFESGVGRVRVAGWTVTPGAGGLLRILDYAEGPDVTTSAVEYPDGVRALVINGFVASSEVDSAHYMGWMGHAPMLQHPDPGRALVIAFGTGQTAHAVRQERPRRLDVVDINPRVLDMAHHFPKNQRVLDDPRVYVTTMDGRAFLRRSSTSYDVITLEPMPPTFAGVNALYSREFYEFARARLTDDGVMAQWLPLHLVSPRDMMSIVKTFQSVFPNAIVWMDSGSRTGMIIGSVQQRHPLADHWPGLARTDVERDLTDAEIRRAVWLDAAAMRSYAEPGQIITDDNQLLAYGPATASLYNGINNLRLNNEILARYRIDRAGAEAVRR